MPCQIYIEHSLPTGGIKKKTHIHLMYGFGLGILVKENKILIYQLHCNQSPNESFCFSWNNLKFTQDMDSSTNTNWWFVFCLYKAVMTGAKQQHSGDSSLTATIWSAYAGQLMSWDIYQIFKTACVCICSKWCKQTFYHINPPFGCRCSLWPGP